MFLYPVYYVSESRAILAGICTGRDFAVELQKILGLKDSWVGGPWAANTALVPSQLLVVHNLMDEVSKDEQRPV